jgi:hypothetical protein
MVIVHDNDVCYLSKAVPIVFKCPLVTPHPLPAGILAKTKADLNHLFETLLSHKASCRSGNTLHDGHQQARAPHSSTTPAEMRHSYEREI